MSWRQILLNNCWRKMRHWHQEKGHHFSSLALESLISMCSFAQPLGHVLIGQFNLSVCRTGVGEFIPGVGVLQVPPNSTDLWWDLKVTVLLRNHLSVERNMMLVYVQTNHTMRILINVKSGQVVTCGPLVAYMVFI